MLLSDFLEQMNADLKNEWTHLHFYLHHAAMASGLHADAYREFLVAAAKGELDHVLQFTQRLLGLSYPHPATAGKEFPTFTDVADILAHATLMENEVVNTYAARLDALDKLKDEHPVTAAYLKIFYERQLEDSYEDAEKMRRLIHDKGAR